MGRGERGGGIDLVEKEGQKRNISLERATTSKGQEVVDNLEK